MEKTQVELYSDVRHFDSYDLVIRSGEGRCAKSRKPSVEIVGRNGEIFCVYDQEYFYRQQTKS